MMQAWFEQLCASAFDALQSGEQLSLELHAEDSHFIRINGAKVRQTGSVNDRSLTLTLGLDNKSAGLGLTLSETQQDEEELLASLQNLREEVAQLPDDPYYVAPSGGSQSEAINHGTLLDSDSQIEQLLTPMSGHDITGIYASGRIYRGYANSAGSRHWFESDRFSMDYSLVSADERMVKATYAGVDWDAQAWQAHVEDSVDKLQMLGKPGIKIQPGQYRTFIASAGIADILDMFSWHGLGEGEIRSGGSAFVKMRQQGIQLSEKFTLTEDFSSGQVPRFNALGEVADEKRVLIDQGRLQQTLVSSRTAREYGLESSFAPEEEYLRLPVMQGGELPEKDVLEALGSGVYLSNLHYLNWSDVSGGRITGMTRYACFWVEEGEIKGPIENMRFDDSFYYFFGENLEALTRETPMNPEVGTYEERSLGMTVCPGVLLKAFTFTL